MQALVRRNNTWEYMEFGYIRKGDIFRMFEDRDSVEENQCYVWRALSNSVRDGDEWIVAKEPVIGKLEGDSRVDKDS